MSCKSEAVDEVMSRLSYLSTDQIIQIMESIRIDEDDILIILDEMEVYGALPTTKMYKLAKFIVSSHQFSIFKRELNLI